MEKPINPLFNVHEKYKDVRIINPYRFGQLRRDLVAYWTMDNNASSSAVVDSIGGYNGVLNKFTGSTETEQNTSAATVSGKINSGLTFKTSGSFDQYVNIRVPDNDVFSFGNGTSDIPFSFSFWIYMNSWGAGATTKYTFIIARKENVSPWTNVEYQVDTTTDLSTFYRLNTILYMTGGTVNIRCVVDLTSGFINAWRHIVITYDGSGSESGLNTYIDGVKQTSTNTMNGTYTAMSNTSAPLIFSGQRSLTTSSYGIDGILDEVSIWRNRVLGHEDVQLLYNEGNGYALPNW
jgi:hypothetical protein